MGTKSVCLFFFLANICLVHPVQLTREIVPKNVKFEEHRIKSQTLNLQEILQTIPTSNILDSLIDSVLESQAENILTLIEKIQSNSQDLESIFDTLNAGLGANVLKVNDEVLRVDTAQLETFALNQMRSLAKALYPKDVLQQIMVYSVGTGQIRNVMREIKPELENIGVPLKVLAAVLPKFNSEASGISKRDTTDLISVIITLFKTQICAVFSVVFTTTNSTLTTVINNLESASLDTSSITNELLEILALMYNSFLVYAEEIAQYALDIVESTYTSTCSSSSSRKRRDIYEQEYFNRLSDDTELLEVFPEARSLRMRRDIWSTIWTFLVTIYTNYIAAILSVALKGFASAVLTYVQGIVDTFLNTTVLAFAYSIINVITLQS